MYRKQENKCKVTQKRNQRNQKNIKETGSTSIPTKCMDSSDEL